MSNEKFIFQLWPSSSFPAYLRVTSPASDPTNTWHSPSWQIWSHPQTKAEFSIALQSAKALSELEFESCFRLIEHTSSEDYKNSKDGWKPKAKKKEMKLLDLKYFLIKDGTMVVGFVSFMPTYEDGYPVIYCYEIHLSSALQG